MCGSHFFVCLFFDTGESSALETHILQLDKALDTSRFQIQQTENIIRSKTPTGPELDSSYKGYVRVLDSHYVLTLLKITVLSHGGVFWNKSQISTPSLGLLERNQAVF